MHFFGLKILGQQSGTRYPITSGYDGDFLFSLSDYRGPYVEREPVITQIVESIVPPKLCIVCGEPIAIKARNIKTCSTACRLKRKETRVIQTKVANEVEKIKQELIMGL